MRPLLRGFLAAIVVALGIAAPSDAILEGQPDADHPYVGILVTILDGQPTPVCSGFLVSTTVFVTAAHCIDDLGGSLPAYVSFDQTFTPDSALLHGTPVPNPAFGSPGSNTHDIALVVLDSAVSDLGFAELPTQNLLDSVKKKTRLTIVGYGADGFVKRDGHRVPNFDFVRRVGRARLQKLQRPERGLNLKMSNGICFGDSGGPVFLRRSNVAVGISSFVRNKNCRGGAFAFRLDTAESLAFLAPYL